MKSRFRNVPVILLIAIGCLQFIGYIFSNSKLRGLGIAYCASPLPTVFSTINGVEGFDTKHTIHFTNDKGKRDTIKLDQHLFSQFNEHYFLKQSYSLFLAYPHIMKPCMIEDGLDFSLCRGNIFKSFEITGYHANISIQIERSRFNKNEKIILTPYCNY